MHGLRRPSRSARQVRGVDLGLRRADEGRRATRIGDRRPEVVRSADGRGGWNSRTSPASRSTSHRVCVTWSKPSPVAVVPGNETVKVFSSVQDASKMKTRNGANSLALRRGPLRPGHRRRRLLLPHGARPIRRAGPCRPGCADLLPQFEGRLDDGGDPLAPDPEPSDPSPASGGGRAVSHLPLRIRELRAGEFWCGPGGPARVSLNRTALRAVRSARATFSKNAPCRFLERRRGRDGLPRRGSRRGGSRPRRSRSGIPRAGQRSAPGAPTRSRARAYRFPPSGAREG